MDMTKGRQLAPESGSRMKACVAQSQMTALANVSNGGIDGNETILLLDIPEHGHTVRKRQCVERMLQRTIYVGIMAPGKNRTDDWSKIVPCNPG